MPIFPRHRQGRLEGRAVGAGPRPLRRRHEPGRGRARTAPAAAAAQ
eukprot:SM015058S01738  [mRNA]  locus=s15058:47:181:- [translate_table: standard]